MTVERPRPTMSNERFWEGCRRGVLTVQRCTGCAALRHYPQPMCPECHSLEREWVELRGTGTVYSFTVSHRAFHPHWADCVPYVIATIELDEGVRMVCDMPGLAPDEVAIGAKVEVFFEQVDDELTLPRFRIVDATGASSSREAT